MSIVSTSNTGLFRKRGEMPNCRIVKIYNTKIAIVDLIDYEDGKMITRINVPIAFRGKGIGSALLEEVLDDSRQFKVPLYLGISPSDGLDFNQLKAWYIRHGFRYVGYEIYKFDPTITAAE